MIAGQDILKGTNIEVDPNDGKVYPGYRNGEWIATSDIKAGDEVGVTAAPQSSLDNWMLGKLPAPTSPPLR